MHQALIITDLGFGDAGKGSITDALARRGASLVVRYNGGAQAAHTVVDERGRCHIFHQFGSGTLVDGVETLLSRFVLVNPLTLHFEAVALAALGITDAPQRLFIEAQALVTTPFQMIFNQLRELSRGANRHGSCGLGIGETACDALQFGPKVLRFGDLSDSKQLQRKLNWHRDLKRRQLKCLMPQLCEIEGAQAQKVSALLDQLHSEEEMNATQEVFETIAERFQLAPPNFLAAKMSQPGTTVFEGAQGVLLDESRGFHPYTTWSNTTPANALRLIEEAQCSLSSPVQTTVLGLTRAYQTRHGAGPFPTEDDGVTSAVPEPHNPANEWQGPFRAGWLDLPLLRYAVRVSGRIDGLVVTCLDRLEALAEVKIGVGYKFEGAPWHLDLDARGSGDLAAQEKAGERLRKVKVSYQAAPAEGAAYARTVAEALELPLWGTSNGPTAGSKCFKF